MRFVLAAFLLAAVASPSPALAINKCVDASGKVSYQEGACAGAGEAVKTLQIRNAEPPPKSMGETYIAEINAMSKELDSHYKELNRLTKENIAACGARADAALAVGMSEGDFLCTRVGIANAENVRSLATKKGTQKQYAVKRAQKSPMFVYVENGAVTAIQE